MLKHYCSEVDIAIIRSIMNNINSTDMSGKELSILIQRWVKRIHIEKTASTPTEQILGVVLRPTTVDGPLEQLERMQEDLILGIILEI